MNYTIEIDTIDALLIVQLLHDNYLKNETDKLIAENLRNKIIDMVGKELTKKQIKHGSWHLLDECANEGVYCSVCSKKVYKTDYANQKLKSKFCPNCGATMDGEFKEL